MADRFVTEGILIGVPAYMMSRQNSQDRDLVLTLNQEDGTYARLDCLVSGTLRGWPCHVGHHIEDMGYSFGRVRITIERLDDHAEV